MERRSFSPEQITLTTPVKREPVVEVGEVIFDASNQNESEVDMVTISYKEWIENGQNSETGVIITDVPPRNLFTTQDWLDPVKAPRAHIAQEEMLEDAFTVEGVVYQHPKEHMGKVLVVLEGNHRTVSAMVHHSKVQFKLIDHELSPETPVWRTTNLARKYNDWYSKGL